ncbi:MAG: DUF423 domain-containing protein [Bacteroidota bacterium]|nr:DUF423 domain-containing protein [Bacteroidota bacterium]
MKAKLFLQFSILSIAISIILGAFGAHALKDIFNDYSKEIWEKGILYQLTNSLGLLLIIILQNQNLLKRKTITLVLISLGIILFSGSLYGLSLSISFFQDQIWLTSLFGPITPIGGTLIITGWIYAFFSVIKK